jgi:ATP-dependent Clp protease, protease subunit
MRTHRLMQLFQANLKSPRLYKVEASAANNDEATIFMYDVIGYDWWSGGGITAIDFAKDLSALETSGVKKVHLRINSPGGDVFEGRAIVAAMQRTKMTLVAHIDGLAASASSFIAVHAHEVEITDGAFIMIHNGWTIAVGDRHAFTKTAGLLEKVDGTIADDYAKKTGIDKNQLSAFMDDETWFSAAEAVANKFADRIEESNTAKTSARTTAPTHDDQSEIEATKEHDQMKAHRERRLQLIEKTAA